LNDDTKFLNEIYFNMLDKIANNDFERYRPLNNKPIITNLNDMNRLKKDFIIINL